MSEQTVEAGTVATVIVQTIDENGDHVAASIDTTTTRLQKGTTADTDWNSAAPTVDTITTGVYRVKWTGLSPAIAISDNDDRLRAKINGTIAGVPWTEYHIPLRAVMGNSAAENLETSAGQIVVGEVETGTTAASGATFATNLTVDEAFEGRTLIFTNGVNKRLPLRITDASLTSGELVFTVEDYLGNEMPATPLDGNTFMVV